MILRTYLIFGGLFSTYQSRGVRLVASTYSPHMQTSPPMTSLFCSSEAVKEQ